MKHYVFDLDGVIASYDNKLFHRSDDYEYYPSRELWLNPDKLKYLRNYTYSILTGRTPALSEITYRWLSEKNIRKYQSVYFVGEERLYTLCKGKQELNWRYHNYVAFRKIEFLRLMSPDKYFDDNEQVLATINDVLPNLKTVLCKKKEIL